MKLIPVLLAMSVSGCALSRGPVDHAVSYTNCGEPVQSFKIRYGSYDFPKHPTNLGYNKCLGGAQYRITIPVPEVAVVEWVSPTGQHHSETVELYAKLKDKSWFNGDGKLIFEVENETVHVYLVRELPNFKQERSQLQ
ncbi:MAG: hypothetical protein V4607_00575 [Pseudomonadota bacterium]